MTDYSETFIDVFTTRHNLNDEQIKPVIKVLEYEISENLVYDHFHPEIAGKLQFAVHFLQIRKDKEVLNDRQD